MDWQTFWFCLTTWWHTPYDHHACAAYKENYKYYRGKENDHVHHRTYETTNSSSQCHKHQS